MKNIKYILTKYESVRKTEKIEYEIEIPEKIKNKISYADKKVLENDYTSLKIVDVSDSEMTDDEIESLRKIKTETAG